MGELLWLVFILVIFVTVFLAWECGRRYGYAEGYVDGCARGADDTAGTPKRFSERWAENHPDTNRESTPPTASENNESSQTSANGGRTGETITRIFLALTTGSSRISSNP